jgi:poly(A) polymerase/tRNA nucleotidyltransferase (CCA-adding enzyme)
MKAKIEKFNIPQEVSHVTKRLKEASFEAYLVGGCVRDLFMGRAPKDWDVTTDALPDQIIPLFKKTFYENAFGTVAVVNEEVENESLKVVEVTPFRIESGYSDHRRPDLIEFSKDILEDLKRRDFTINSMAYDPENAQIIDPFGGIADLNNRIIRAVGDPNLRLTEDGLRILRAIRFHVELGFEIDPSVEKSISENRIILKDISAERIRDEFEKIIMSPNPSMGIEVMKKLGVLEFILPELIEGIGVEQNKAHSYDVWTHILKTLQHSADKKMPLHVRLAAIFHDISKPSTRRWDNNAKIWTFYGHEVVGSRVTEKVLERLKFSRETINQVKKLVRWHMFFSDTEKITHSAVRRLIVNVGKESIWDLIELRTCDRIGTGRPKENPYRLRKYRAMIEEVMRNPISPQMLKIDGRKIMQILSISPGPKIGQILNILLDEALENPDINTEEELNKRTIELNKLSDKELAHMAYLAKNKIKMEENTQINKIRSSHHVE